jgi:hypothetical protein
MKIRAKQRGFTVFPNRSILFTMDLGVAIIYLLVGQDLLLLCQLTQKRSKTMAILITPVSLPRCALLPADGKNIGPMPNLRFPIRRHDILRPVYPLPELPLSAP